MRPSAERPTIDFNILDQETFEQGSYCRVYQKSTGELIFKRDPHDTKVFILFKDGSFGYHKLSPGEEEEMFRVNVTGITTIKI